MTVSFFCYRCGWMCFSSMSKWWHLCWLGGQFPMYLSIWLGRQCLPVW